MKLSDIKEAKKDTTNGRLDQAGVEKIRDDAVACMVMEPYMKLTTNLVNVRDKSISIIEYSEVVIKPEIKELPVKFGTVKNFSLGFTSTGISLKQTQSNLETLKNCPDIVSEKFSIRGSKIKSLQDGPKLVGEYDASKTLIKDLKGLTTVINKTLTLNRCDELVSLEGLQNVPLVVINNCVSLTSLHDIHKHVKNVEVLAIDESAKESSVKDSILGLLLISGLKHVYFNDTAGDDFVTAMEILRKYLGKGREVLFDCQQELIDAGLVDFAKL